MGGGSKRHGLFGIVSSRYMLITSCLIYAVCHEWKRVNCVILIERPFGLYIELQEDTPNPRLEGYDYNTLRLSLTPPLKCNVNAMSLHLKSGTKYMS